MLIEKHRIEASEVGPSRCLSFSSLLSLIEGISIKDVIRGGLPKEKTLDLGFLWVISRLSLHINRLPSYDEDIVVESFALNRLRSFFLRGYRILSNKGEILLEGEGIWALISKESRKVIDPVAHHLRIRQAKIPANYSPSSFSFAPSCPASTIKTATRQVLESELDINNHLTNTRYGAWFIDEVGEETYLKAKQLIIGFYEEATLGEEISLSLKKDEDHLLFEGKEKEKPLFYIDASF
jgi:medium-chain acyl-[acyl-carrier-protein] hydrolase